MTDPLDVLFLTEKEETIYKAGFKKGKGSVTTERIYRANLVNSIHTHFRLIKKDFEKLEESLNKMQDKQEGEN